MKYRNINFYIVLFIMLICSIIIILRRLKRLRRLQRENFYQKSKCYKCETESCNIGYPSKCYDCQNKSSVINYILDMPGGNPKLFVGR